MRTRASQPLRLLGLGAVLAFVAALLPLPWNQAFAATEYCIDCNRYTEGTYVYEPIYGTVSYEPTCTESGQCFFICGNCGNVAGPIRVAALGHDYSVSHESSATCTSGGSITYACSRCGDSYTESTSALGHSYYLDEDVAATCTDEGTRTYRCSRCGASYFETDKALGHDYVETVTDPTCTDEGAKTSVCSRCNDTKTEPIPALGHDMATTWTVETEPTLLADGLEYRTCARCGLCEERIIPKTLVTDPGMLAGLVCGGIVVVGGIAFGVRRLLLARGAAAAAEGGLGFEIIKVTNKRIFAKVDEPARYQEFFDLVNSRHNLTLILFNPEQDATLAEQIDQANPDAVILEAADPAGIESAMQTIAELRAELEPDRTAIKYELIAPTADTAAVSELEARKTAGDMFAYASASDNKYVTLSKLIVPLYKNLMTDADTLANVGIIADIFGIPAISELLGLASASERTSEIAQAAVDTFEGTDMELADGVSVINNIAELLGVNAVANATDIAELVAPAPKGNANDVAAHAAEDVAAQAEAAVD